MANKLINDYPYTNMTYQNVDWLVDIVSKLVEKGKDNGEIKADDEVAAAYDQFINNYPYTNMTYQNIDWWINKVREIGAEQVKLIAQVETLQADVDNVTTKLGDKVDKLNVKNNVYVTDGSTPPKTTGIAYSELPVEGTIPIRDGIGSLQVPTAQDATQAVNKGQMDTALDGKVNKTTARQVVYARDSEGNESALSYDSEATVSVAVRGQNGVLKVGAPVANNDATTKEYVDNAIATAPTGGWTTIFDKTWTEDETTVYSIIKDIPAEYQKAMSELRMTYYNNTPQAGAVYSNQFVHIRLYDGEQTMSFMYTGNILPTKDTKEVTVNFVGTNFNVIPNTIHWDSPTEANAYQLNGIQDANGNKVIPIPTDPAALLNTSKITKAMISGSGDTAVDWTIDSYSPNVTHTVITSDNKTITITTNDYYNSEHPEYKLSHVINSTDTTLIPVGYMVCPNNYDMKWVTDATIVFTSTASVSYKNVVTRQAVIVGETFQVIAGAENIQNTMTSFNDTSINCNSLPGGYAYYSHLKNGYPTKIYLYPQSSTSAGVTAKKIYAGSRLVLQVRY